MSKVGVPALKRNNNIDGESSTSAFNAEDEEFWRYAERAYNRASFVRTETIQQMFDRCMRISHSLPKFKEQLWIECVDKLTEASFGVIEFAKCFFNKLHMDDKICLLQKGAFELIVIRLSRYIDPSTNCLVFGKMILPERAFYATFMEEIDLVSSIFKLAKDIADLKLTVAELAIYSAVVLFDDGKVGLIFRNEIKRQKENMLRALKVKLDHSNKQPLEIGVTVYDALIAKIPELRMISFMYLNAVEKFGRSHPHIKLPEIHQELFSKVTVYQSKL